jgi:hypothetical protein
MENRQDINEIKSQRTGLSGLLENILRKFQVLAHLVLVTPLYLVASICLGLAIVPGFFLFTNVMEWTQSWSDFPKFWALGSSLAAGYFLYGFSMLCIAPFMNFIFRSSLKEWRGAYYSLPAVQWYIHNGLTYLVRYTFLEFVTPTPFNLYFYRMMGMKIGDGTLINSTHLSDPSLIELGRKVTLGGSVTIVGHYGQGGFLVLAPVKIGDKATIGLKAIIMGGVVIGDGAKILPGSAVLPKTVVPAGETWGGVPARKIEFSDKKAILQSAV